MGHALTKRLSKQISKATKGLKNAVDEYNRPECSARWPFTRSVDFDQVKNPEADIWIRCDLCGARISSPHKH